MLLFTARFGAPCLRKGKQEDNKIKINKGKSNEMTKKNVQNLRKSRDKMNK